MVVIAEIVTELVTVENFIKSLYPSSVYKQEIPLRPDPDTFSVRAFSSSHINETGYHYRIDRTYQIMYIAENHPQLLSRIDSLGRALYGVLVIPIEGSDNRYLRVMGYNTTAPFETENDLYGQIAVLDCAVREARSQPEYQKIMHIFARYMTRVQI